MNTINSAYSSNNFELLQEFLDNILRSNTSYLKYFGSSHECYENFEKYVKNVFLNKDIQKLVKKIEFYKKNNGKSSKKKQEIYLELVEKQLIKNIEEYISLQKIGNTTNIFKEKIVDIISNVGKVFLSKKELIKKTVCATALTATIFTAGGAGAEYNAEQEYIEQSKLRLAEIQKQTEQKIANITIDPEIEKKVFYETISKTDFKAADFFSGESNVSLDDLNFEQIKVLFASIYGYGIATEYLFDFTDNETKNKTLLANIIALHYKETGGNFGFCVYGKDPTYNKTGQENIGVNQISIKGNVMEKYLETNLIGLKYLKNNHFNGDINKLDNYINIIKNKHSNVGGGWNEQTVKNYFDKLEKELDLSKEQIELITMIGHIENRNDMFNFDGKENIWVGLTNPNLSETGYIEYISENMQGGRRGLGIGVKKIKENNGLDNQKIALVSRGGERSVNIITNKLKQEKIKEIKKEEAELIEKEGLIID